MGNMKTKKRRSHVPRREIEEAPLMEPVYEAPRVQVREVPIPVMVPQPQPVYEVMVPVPQPVMPVRTLVAPPIYETVVAPPVQTRAIEIPANQPQSMFDQLDRNHDGVITRAEF